MCLIVSQVFSFLKTDRIPLKYQIMVIEQQEILVSVTSAASLRQHLTVYASEALLIELVVQ